MKKILILVIMIIISTQVFAWEEVRIFDLSLDIDDNTIAVDEIDIDGAEALFNMLLGFGVKIKSITPISVSIPTSDGKMVPLTKYVMVVFEHEEEDEQ